MPDFTVIVIGASVGGVEGLIKLVGGLPADLPAAVFITLHLSPNNTSFLPSILTRAGNLTARHPEDLDPIVQGQIYVAPPDHHLLVEHGIVRVTRGPKENGHRPAVDALFRTAAAAYGPKVIGVILSGSRDDGTVGLQSIKSEGGIVIAQEPSEALYPSMPQNAIDHVEMDYILRVADIPPLVAGLVERLNALPESPPLSTVDGAEIVAGQGGPDSMPGQPSGFICPDCGGALWETNSNGLLHYRCHVGHAWSSESLLDAELAEVEEALWTAYRSLQDHMNLAGRVAQNARRRGNDRVAVRFEERVEHLRSRAAVIRQLLLGGENNRPDIPGSDTKGGGDNPDNGSGLDAGAGGWPFTP